MAACLGPPPQQFDRLKNFFGCTPLSKFSKFYTNPLEIFEYLNFLRLAPFNLFLFVAWFLVLFYSLFIWCIFSGSFDLFLFGGGLFLVWIF